MKKIFKLTLLLSILAFAGCDKLISTEVKPEFRERQMEYEIILVDSSGYMQKLFGSNRVPGAEVMLKSNTLGTEYRAVSDENGVIRIKGIISDNYHISVTRNISPVEMQAITGNSTVGYKLINKITGVICLKGDNADPLEVALNSVYGGSPLVINEIYASGPTGSGLYFHDKYIEIFNQSDSVVYLDQVLVALVYSSSYLGLNYVNDPQYVHSINIWMFPGSGHDYPLNPGQYTVCAEDAIDHRTNAPNSVDLSRSGFEFYKDDAPDIDNVKIPNMVRIFQNAGNDWLLGGETGGVVIARLDRSLLKTYDDQMLIPYTAILDGVEYMKDPSKLDKKMVNPSIDAGATGGIQFYTGKSMERVIIHTTGGDKLLDNGNSSLDFRVIDKPTPGYHY